MNYGPLCMSSAGLGFWNAFQAAGERCGDLKIIYDARPGKSHPVETSDKCIEAAKLRPWMIPRTANPSYIAHNKFIVLLKDGKPVAGLDRHRPILREGGIFGQSNVGHIVRDRKVARQYLNYWDRLAEDPGATELRAANVEATPIRGVSARGRHDSDIQSANKPERSDFLCGGHEEREEHRFFHGCLRSE